MKLNNIGLVVVAIIPEDDPVEDGKMADLLKQL